MVSLSQISSPHLKNSSSNGIYTDIYYNLNVIFMYDNFTDSMKQCDSTVSGIFSLFESDNSLNDT